MMRLKTIHSLATSKNTSCLVMHTRPSSIHLALRGARRSMNTHKSGVGTWNKLKPRIKSPGGKYNIFSERITSSLVTRIPLSILFLIFLNDEKYSPIPFTFEFMAGPSMLPTIFPIGECYIRLKWWFLNENLKVGDIVVFQDLKGGLTCKRIVGLEGDAVNRFGEYVHLYQNESDHGIRKIPMKFTWQDEIGVAKVDGKTMVTVPPGNVWVEGDNPLHSVDSRHYGPIATSRIRGKVIYRLWPRQRNDQSPCLVKSIRPHPLTETEMFNGSYSIEKVPYSK